MTSTAWGRRVLIIDDNVNLAENIAEMLEIEGFATQVAASAEEGAEMAREEEPDVVVTDYHLPGLNGADFVRAFRVGHLNVRAIVISADTDDATMQKAAEAGATFIAKPFDLGLLGRCVRGGLT